MKSFVLRLAILLSAAVVLCDLAQAQQPNAGTQRSTMSPALTSSELAAKVPAPKPDDVSSIDAIVRAAYQSISGPAGPRDWNRFRSLFLPSARFTHAGKKSDGTPVVVTWGVEEFIRDGSTVFAKEAFYETGIVNKVDRFGDMAQVFTSYESRHSPDDKPFQRGINSMQVVNDGKRWWLVSIAWDSERPGNPLPSKFADRKSK